MSKGGGGSATRHVIEVFYQVMGQQQAAAGINGMNKSLATGQTTLDKYGMSATKAATETTKLSKTASEVAPSTDKATGSVQKLGKAEDDTAKKTKNLSGFFSGNKGLIFSVTMLSSGIFEAIGMFQGYQDASEKLAAAKQKVADLEAAGMENTKDYGDAVREAADAQRGYNFITRFTIQSFADLIPMSLLMTSSLIEMNQNFMTGATQKEKFAAVSHKVAGGLKAIAGAMGITTLIDIMSGNFMKGTSIKEKFAAASAKVTSALKTLGVAMMAFTRAHPLLLLLTLIAAAATAVFTNVGGLRDRFNELGVALGNAVPGLKGFLTMLGSLGSQFNSSSQEAAAMSEKTTKAMQEIEREVLRTGDATKLSIEEQMALYGKLGDEAEHVHYSLATHWKMYKESLIDSQQRYAEFVTAFESGSDDLMQSAGFTAEEFEKYYEQMVQSIEDFESSFNDHVQKVVENYKKFEDTARTTQEEQSSQLDKLKEKLVEHYKKRDEIREKEGEGQDKAMEKWEEEKDAILEDIKEIDQGLSDMAISAREDWAAFSSTGKEALEQFHLEAISGNFPDAIETITTAMDNVPEKYQQNMGTARSILENESVSMEARADLFAAHMDTVNPFQSFTVGAQEYTLEQAQVTSGLDELTTAAMKNVNSMDDMPAAWDSFVASLTPAQRNLPIVQNAIELVNAGAIDQATAFGMVKAAGEKMSAQLGGTVTQTFNDLKKTIITMPDGTKQAFANIGGQVVSLGEVSDDALVSGQGSFFNSMDKTKSQSATLAMTVENEMDKSGTAVETFSTDSTSWLDKLIGLFQRVAGEVGKLPQTLKTALSAESIKGAWEGFQKAFSDTGTWVNNGVTAIGTAIKGAITIENAKAWWNGFWGAISEGASVITSGIAVLATTIASDIKTKATAQKWWQGFWDAMSETVDWISTGIGAIGQEITTQLTSEKAATWWAGFQTALSEKLEWVSTGIGAIGAEIAAQITPENAAAWWQGFYDAMSSTFTWISTGISLIGGELAKTITTEGPKWWIGFENALGAVVTWVSGGIEKIGNEIIPTIEKEGPKWWIGFQKGMTSILTWVSAGVQTIGAQVANTIVTDSPKWWIGFQKAFTSTLAWATAGVKTIGAQIANTVVSEGPKWWKGFQDALGATTDWVAGQIGKVAQAILDYPWAEVGKGILAKIGEGLGAIGKGATDLGGIIGGLFTGGGKDKNYLTPISYGQDDNQMKSDGPMEIGKKEGQFDSLIKQLHLLDMALAQAWKTFSGFSTSVSTYMTSMTTAVGGFLTKTIQGWALYDQGIKVLWATFSQLSTSVTTYMGSMTASVGQFLTTTVQGWTLYDQALKVLWATFSQLSTSVTTYMGSMTASVGQFLTTTVQGWTLYDQALKLLWATFSQLSTSVTTYMGSMTTSIGTFLMTTTQGWILYDQALKILWGTFSQLSTSVTTYSASMGSSITQFTTVSMTALTQLEATISKVWGTASQFSTSISTYATSMGTSMKKFSTDSVAALTSFDTAVGKSWGNMSKFSTSMSTYSSSMSTAMKTFSTQSTAALRTFDSAVLKSGNSVTKLSSTVSSESKKMASALKSFSSSAVSSLNAVASAAKKAESALKSMAAAAAKAKSARSGLRFGGAFVTGQSEMNQSSFAQQGKSWINSRPRKIAGVNISEFSKPELVTVTPLSNPSDPMDKGISGMDGMPVPKIPDLSGAVANAASSVGGNSNKPIIVKGDMHVVVRTSSGKVLATEIQPYLMEGYSGIT